MAVSAKGDKPFEVDPSAKYLGDGIYLWCDMQGFLVMQRQPQYTGDSNWWRVMLDKKDADYIARLTQPGWCSEEMP